MSPVRKLDNDHQVYGVMGNLRPHDIVFDPSDPACLSRDGDDQLTFRFLAPVDTAEALVVIRTADEVIGHEMHLVGAAHDVSFWEVTLAPATERIRFSLALRLEAGTPIYFGVTGVSGAIERIDRFEVDVADVIYHAVPEWMRGAVIYQIFPERFASGDDSLTPPDAMPWDAMPTRTGFQGGDLAGIANHLDHLEELGVDMIYLNPIFASPSNHRYDTADYYTVDPALGDNDAFDALVKAAHERGIKIMLDVSLNHVHPTFAGFQDLIEKGPNSGYANWFDVTEYPPHIKYRPDLVDDNPFWSVRIPELAEATGMDVIPVSSGPMLSATYDSWYGVPEMPRVDLQHAPAREYMVDVAAHWIANHNIDAWRMDVVRYIDHDFWLDVRQAVHKVRPDAYLLAEVMGDSRRWLRGDEFDATMNYTFREMCLDFFGRRAINAEEFVAGYLRTLAMYSPAVTEVSHNLLSSHDTARFLHLAEEDEQRLLLATAFQLTTPGAPGLYYGDELPLTGGEDPDCRRTFDWDRVDGPHHAAVRGLGQLRRHHEALRTGSITMLPIVDQCVSFVRTGANENLFVAINNGATKVELGVDPGHHPGDVLWAVGTVAVGKGPLGNTVVVGPHGAIVGVSE